MTKEVFSFFAIVLTFVAMLPYILGIIKGAIKPHVFSWVIWASTTFIVFCAQLKGGAGVGAWAIGVSGVITFFVAFWAYVKRTDLTITRADWVFFVTGLSALPFWYFTDDPLWAVVILTTVDVFGFGPTMRKAYFLPYSESVLFFALFMVRNTLVILGLEYYSLTTVLFPLAMTSVCVVFVIMLLYRRRVLSNFD